MINDDCGLGVHICIMSYWYHKQILYSRDCIKIVEQAWEWPRNCWEKWHGWRMDTQRISHVQEASHLNATSKSQASNKQDSLSLLSTNLASKTTVVLGTATTILEIGISFPTLVDRRSRHYMVVLPESFCCRVIKMQQNERSHFYHRRLANSIIGT
jgi:hypothetical protein